MGVNYLQEIQKYAKRKFDGDEISLIEKYYLDSARISIWDKRKRRDIARFYLDDKALRVKHDGSLEECSLRKVESMERYRDQRRQERFKERERIGKIPLYVLREKFEKAIKKKDIDVIKKVRRKLRIKQKWLYGEYWVMYEHPLPGDNPSKISFQEDLVKSYIQGLNKYINSNGHFIPRFPIVLSDLFNQHRVIEHEKERI